VANLRLHLFQRTPISDLCDQHGIHPTMFYRWQKQFFENGAAAFESPRRRTGDDNDRRIILLQQKLQRKNEVLSELMEDHIQPKKRAWGTLNGVWVPQSIQDAVVQFVSRWAKHTELPIE
jgi:transposase-like protein